MVCDQRRRTGLNPNHEVRKSKEYQNPNRKIQKPLLCCSVFWVSSLEFPSDFGFLSVGHRLQASAQLFQQQLPGFD